jgi:hypothetical protein
MKIDVPQNSILIKGTSFCKDLLTDGASWTVAKAHGDMKNESQNLERNDISIGRWLYLSSLQMLWATHMWQCNVLRCGHACAASMCAARCGLGQKPP